MIISWLIPLKLSRAKHSAQSVCIRSYSGPYFSRIFPHSDWIRRDTSPNVGKYGKNADQNNSEYGQFLRSGSLLNSFCSPEESLQIRDLKHDAFFAMCSFSLCSFCKYWIFANEVISSFKQIEQMCLIFTINSQPKLKKIIFLRDSPLKVRYEI